MNRYFASVKWWGPPLVVLASVLAFNFFGAHLPAAAKLEEDPRNRSVSWAVYHRWGISPRVIVLDIRQLNNASMADVDRALFQIAERFSGRNYDLVLLAHRGEAKFQLEGTYFSRLGDEYRYQNPLVLIRELPSHTFTLDGQPAFSEWSGGWLGVINAQMEDHATLHQVWYADDLTRH